MRTRAEREAEARRLREQGLLLREIAERMGVATQTVHAWLNDPGGKKLRARQASYAGTCESCGGPTDGHAGPGKSPRRCMDCVTWTREGVLLAFTEWGDDHGGLPPRSVDATRGYEGHGSLPNEHVVRRLFGSWNAGLLAAGYSLRCDRRPETLRDIFDSITTGEPIASIAERYGVSEEAIRQRVRWRGLTVADLRNGRRAA